MTAAELLEGLRAQRARTERKRAYLMEIEASTGVGAAGFNEKVTSSANASIIERITERREKARGDYLAEYEKLIAMQAAAQEILDSLPEPTAEILQRRYIRGQKWEPIAEGMHFSERYLFRAKKDVWPRLEQTPIDTA